MGWNDFYQRREITQAVLSRAARNPAGTLPFDEVPGAAEHFKTPAGLLLALQYKWMQQLTGMVGVALEDATDDTVEAVSSAWRALARDQWVLRTVLDAHTDTDDEALEEAITREGRFLALAAGLVTPFESPAEINRVGKAFLGLLRMPSRVDAGRLARA